MTVALRLPLARAARGELTLPGSKSISNRVLLLAALARGTTRLEGLLDSADTRVMLAALRQLGVSVDSVGPTQAEIRGGAPFAVRRAALFLGNAGTAFRPLTAVLALMGGDYQLSGVPRMHERPIGDLVDALTALGADIQYLGEHGYPPLAIHAGTIREGGAIRVKGSVSSQFLTALLMAAPLLAGLVHRAVAIEVQGELRGGAARRLEAIYDSCRCSLSVAGNAGDRGRRVLRVLFHGAGRHWRRPGTHSGRGFAEHPGRYGFCRYARGDGRGRHPPCDSR